MTPLRRSQVVDPLRLGDALEAAVGDYMASLPDALKVGDWIAFHIPNEGRRGWKSQAAFKRHGGRAGVADWCFLLPDGGVLWVELKAGKSGLSKPQREFRDVCRRLGHAWELVRTVEAWDAMLFRRGLISRRYVR